MLKQVSLVMVVICVSMANVGVAGVIADFEDLSLAPESYWNGSDGSGGFVSGSAWFNNNNYSGWWDGFSYSNITDTTTTGVDGQYNAITGSGQGGSSNYAVGYVSDYYQHYPTISLFSAQVVSGLYVTNNNFAYYSMLNGDTCAKKFGGDTGDDPDWFKLTIKGIDQDGNYTGPVDFYLADYRFTDNSKDYIVNDWEWVDLSSLGTIIGLEFHLSSSDVGPYGMNTPAYFVIDTIIPEPMTIGLMLIPAIVGLSRRKK